MLRILLPDAGSTPCPCGAGHTLAAFRSFFGIVVSDALQDRKNHLKYQSIAGRDARKTACVAWADCCLNPWLCSIVTRGRSNAVGYAELWSSCGHCSQMLR